MREFLLIGVLENGGMQLAPMLPMLMLGLPSIGRQCKVYCLPDLMHGCESWHLQNKEQTRISVAWNNCFRSIFNCCWRESDNPLQYLCKVLPINYLIHQRILLYRNKLFTSDNSVIFLVTFGITKISCN